MVLLEVYKHLLRYQGPEEALKAVAGMRGGTVEPLDENLALLAGDLGIEYGLPLADSIILATARSHEATLWTQDADFKDLEGVSYCRKG